VPHAPPISLSF
jgi:hypothetical protein